MTHSTIHNHSYAGIAAKSLNQPPVHPRHDALVAQSQKWVAQTFFGTLLKQLRDSPFRSELLEGGRGARAFGSLYDQHLVDHLARGSGRKLAESIARKIEGRRAYVKVPSGRPKEEAKSGPRQSLRRSHVSAALRA